MFGLNTLVIDKALNSFSQGKNFAKVNNLRCLKILSRFLNKEYFFVNTVIWKGSIFSIFTV